MTTSPICPTSLAAESMVEPSGNAPPGINHPSTGGFLEGFFSQLQREAIVYAVLRNYEGLPERPGRDIDIFTTDYGRLVTVLRESARKAGYLFRICKRYESWAKFHLVRWGPAGLEVLEFDIAWSVNWKTIPLIPKDLLAQFRLPTRCFYTIRPGAEAAISLTQYLLNHGTAKEKYRPLLPGMARSDPAGFVAALRDCLGISLTTKLFDLTCLNDWRGIEALVPRLRHIALLRAFKHNPLGQILRWFAFIWWTLVRFLRPNGKFVVLIGPDGSGKSTISKKLQQYLQPLFQGSRYFHGHFMILPRLRDLAKLIGYEPSEVISVINPEPGGPGERVVEFGTLRSLLYLFYYSLGYLLGHGVIFRARGRGELVIFDRYYYDYLIQPGMSLPSWFITMVLRLLPEPDLVVYLRNDPQVIFSRKPELTLKELTRQSAICSKLVDRLPQGCAVETLGTPDETTAEIAKILVRHMFNDG